MVLHHFFIVIIATSFYYENTDGFTKEKVSLLLFTLACVFVFAWIELSKIKKFFG